MARNMRPSELDPLEAAAAPITPDPRVRRARSWVQSDIDAHVQATIDASRDRDEAHSVLVAQMIEQGIPPQEAMQLAARDMARDHFNRPVEVDPTPTQFEADYDEATGGPAARAELAGMRPQGSLAPQRTPATAAQIRAAGYQSQAEPGPTSVDGSPVQQGERFTTIEDARDYAVRPPMWNPVSGRGPGAAYAPSEKDKAMMARGFVPVYTPDGRVSYMVGTGFDPAYELQPGQIPGAPGRQGVRLDLQQTDPSKPGFTLEEMNGPIGTVYAYRQNDAARAKQQAYMDERQIARMADASGRSEAELAAMSPDERRRAVRDAKRGDAAARMETWRAQMMLAGRNQAKNAVNAFQMLTPEQQQEVIQANLSRQGRGGDSQDEWTRKLDLMRLQLDAQAREGQQNRDLQREQMDRQGDDADARNQATLLGLKAQLQDISNRSDIENRKTTLAEQEFRDKEKLRSDAATQAAQLKREQEASRYGAGGIHLVRGNYTHPDAQAALRKIASMADQTWNGFFQEDAARMDATLVGLGITDPAVRRQLVQEYGINSDIPGQQGRGSVLSAWRVAHPPYAPVAQ